MNKNKRLKISPDLIPIFDFIAKVSNENYIVNKKLDGNIVLPNFILLFTFLDTIFWIYISYEKETSDIDKIREYMMNTKEKKKFINKYILNDDNIYYKKNIEKFKNIIAKELIYLRNVLVHYYSFGESEILLVNNSFDNNYIRENNKKVLKGDEFYLLIYQSIGMIIDDFMKDQDGKKNIFKRKVSFLKESIKKIASVQINI